MQNRRTRRTIERATRAIAVTLLLGPSTAVAQTLSASRVDVPKTEPAQTATSVPASESTGAQVAAPPSGELQQRLAPGLASLTDDVLYGDIWRRTQLSPRDRSLVTLSVLITTGKTAQLAGHLSRGLENGITPREASGLLAHLAVYSGWPNAVSALPLYDQVYKTRNVDVASLRERAASPQNGSVPPEPSAMTKAVASVAPKFAQLTTDVVEADLWRRSDLAPRDRSLVTIAALAALGETGDLESHARRGLANGLTSTELAEALTHLAFYAGWSRASSAMTVLARVSQEGGR